MTNYIIEKFGYGVPNGELIMYHIPRYWYKVPTTTSVNMLIISEYFDTIAAWLCTQKNYKKCHYVRAVAFNKIVRKYFLQPSRQLHVQN